MRKPLALFAAASLSAGVFAFIGYDSAAFGQANQQKASDVSGSSSSTSGLKSPSAASGKATLPQGTSKSDQTDEAGIRETLRQVTIAIAKDDNLSDLSKYVASTDQAKIRGLQQANQQLKPKLEQLRQDFKAKYQTDVNPDAMVFGKSYDALNIVQGDVTNPALMSNWPASSGSSSGTGTRGSSGSSNLRSDTSGTSSGGLSGSSSSTSGGIGASSSADPSSSSAGTSSADRSSSSSSGAGASSTDRASSSSSGAAGQATAGIQKGFAVAIVTVPATDVAPEVLVSLVRESGAAGAGGTGTGTGTGASGTSPRSDAGSSTGAGSTSSGNAAGAQTGADRSSTSSGTGSTSADRSSSSSGAASSSTYGRGAAGAAGGSDWKVKLPDSQSGDQLQQSIGKHIDMITAMKDKWPADKNEGYRMIAQHFFAALYDTGGATGATGTGTGASGLGTGTGSSTGTGTPGQNRQ